MLRFAVSLLALALIVGTGCSRSDDAAKGAAGVQARNLPEIWADILKQRDLMEVAVSKGTDMWHEDCAAVAKVAVKLDELAIEMRERTRQMTSIEDRRRNVDTVLGVFQSLISQIHNHATQENVGEMSNLIISLDAVLRGVENNFSADEIGSESVATHPHFNPVKPPPPPSPI
jgi:hypothetical protein